MDAEPKTPATAKPRSGSETRQKQRRVTFRLTAEEYATLEAQATAHGLTLGSHIRETLLEAPRTRQRRRPLADVAALARTLGHLNRVGGNINQIARAINYGETPLVAEIQQTLGGLREILAAIRAAMGLGGK
jgi:hypothetical protein